MNVPEPPERYIDDADGAPIEYIEPEQSRFDGIAVKQTDDGIEVRAHDDSSDRMTTFTAQLTDKLLRGVEIDDGRRRRDIDDDVQDALSVVGYVAIDDDIEGY